MLKIVSKMGQLPFGALMEIYAQSNGEMARGQWPRLGAAEALQRAEMEFYQYLRHDFFTMGDSFYALWEEGGKPVAAARLERWRDGWLLEGLETHPDHRGKGYASGVLQGVLDRVHLPVYVHVAKGNRVSLHIHEKCGFIRHRDTALVNGDYDGRFVTLVYKKTHH